MSANQLARVTRYESRPKKILDADLSDLLGSGQISEPIAPEPEPEPSEGSRDLATFARRLLGIILAGRDGEGARRRAVLLAFQYAPSLVWPIVTRADLARELGVTPAAITSQLNRLARETLAKPAESRADVETKVKE